MPEVCETGPDRLEVTASLPALSTDTAFEYMIVPELLRRWWPPQAEVEPRIGCRYTFSWPEQGWHLRGVFTIFEAGRRLAYTWRWDHDSDDAETIVDIRFEPASEGACRLRLTHGLYPDTDAGRERRADHLDGWMYFLARLERIAQD